MTGQETEGEEGDIEEDNAMVTWRLEVVIWLPPAPGCTGGTTIKSRVRVLNLFIFIHSGINFLFYLVFIIDYLSTYRKNTQNNYYK